jgi:hypothetical protein
VRDDTNYPAGAAVNERIFDGWEDPNILQLGIVTADLRGTQSEIISSSRHPKRRLNQESGFPSHDFSEDICRRRSFPADAS